MAPGRLIDSDDGRNASGSESLSAGTSTPDLVDVNQVPIAVVGMAVKLPQDATSAEGFWKMLCEGRCAMQDYPSDRVNIDSYYHPDPRRLESLPLRGGHFLEEDIRLFDAPFFSISATEAVSMDPQQRGLMEIAYQALENAGMPVSSVAKSKTSVYIGSFTNDYFGITSKDPELRAKYAATGLAASILANRISWFYDLRGPSMQLDAACSSSLTAFHQACQSIRTGESSMSLVGGCNLLFNPDFTSALTNLSFLSHDSRCWSFDHRANGYARGEGFTMVILKPLHQAIRDGDTIRAVVRGSGVNSDGHTSGLTQPNEDAQRDLIVDTYRSAGVDMRQTRFFEAHGTGTPIGDPIEARAIGRAFHGQRGNDEPLYVGALKSNVGHLEGSSGLAGVVKAILAMERGMIPPNTNFEKINPQIDTNALNIKLPLECTPWPTDGLRRSSVNCFGFGGSNAHVILDDAYNYMKARGLAGNHRTVSKPPSHGSSNDLRSRALLPYHDDDHQGTSNEKGQSRPYLMLLSSSDEAGVERWTQDLVAHLEAREEDSLPRYMLDLVHTLSHRRSHLAWKSFSVINSPNDLKDLPHNLSKPVRSSQPPQLAWVFTGQGAQWPQMGLDLLQFGPFKESLRQAETYLKGLGCPWYLLDELAKDNASTLVHSAAYSQPLCTAIQVALVDLMHDFGLKPEAVIGHSSGEIAAAYCAGVLSRESAWAIAYYRGYFAAQLTASGKQKHTMISVGASETDVGEMIAQLAQEDANTDLCIACINSPKNVTVSGPVAHVDRLRAVADAREIFARKLRVELGYHSAQMEQIAAEYRSAIADIKPLPVRAGSPVMISSVTGRTASTAELADPTYWVKNLVSPVKFVESLSFLVMKASRSAKKLRSPRAATMKISHLVEIGPHAALKGPIREILHTVKSGSSISYLSALKRDNPGSQTMLELAGSLHCAGYALDLHRVNQLPTRHNPQTLTDLPYYSFNHTRPYWVESRFSTNQRFRTQPRLDLLGTPSTDWNPLEAKWRNIISTVECPWIEDHKVDGICLYPGAGMIVMAIEAARLRSDSTKTIRAFVLENIEFKKNLNVSLEVDGTDTNFYLRPLNNSSKLADIFSFRLCACEQGYWTDICQGTITVEYDSSQNDVDAGFENNHIALKAKETYRALSDASTLCIPIGDVYGSLKEKGLDYGITFQAMQDVKVGNDCATADVDARSWRHRGKEEYMQDHIIHPTTLDGIFQLAMTALSGGREDYSFMIPTRVQRIWISGSGTNVSESSILQSAASTRKTGLREATSDLIALDKSQHDLKVWIEGIDTIEISASANGYNAENSGSQLCYHVEWKPDLTMNADLGLMVQTLEEVKSQETLPLVADAKTQNRLPLATLEFLQSQIGLTVSPLLSEYLSFAESRLRNEQEHIDFDWTTNQEITSEMRQLASTQYQQPQRLTELPEVREDGEGEVLEYTMGRELIARLTQTTLEAHDVCNQLSSLIKLHGHQNPSPSILLIGPGSAAMGTLLSQVISAESEGEERSIQPSLIHYADVDNALSEDWTGSFDNLGDKLAFKGLDLSCDLASQNFSDNTYDLVIAPHLSLFVDDLNTSLLKLKNLLSSEGSLVLLETLNRDSMFAPLVFGFYPQHALNAKDLDDALAANGLTNHIPRLSAQPHTFEHSLILARPIVERQDVNGRHAVIISDGTPLQKHACSRIQEQLRKMNVQLSTKTLASAFENGVAEGSIIILLPDLERALLRDIEDEEFQQLKKILLSGNPILWLTAAQALTGEPVHEMVTGMARSVRTEMSQTKVITIALNVQEEITQRQAAFITEAFQKLHDPSETYEPEYQEMNGLMATPRLVGASYLDRHVSKYSRRSAEALQTIAESPDMIMTVGQPGLLDTIEFHEDVVTHAAPLAADEVEIQVKATGVNFKDCLIALGKVPSTYIGVECAGVVTRAGSQSRFKPNDRVCAVHLGSYRTLVRAKAACTARIPDDMSFAEASALPATNTTVFFALHKVARAAYGESILIHGAAGGTGQAAIQMSKLLGLEIFATVGSAEKRDFLIKEYGIPSSHILYSRDLSFAQGIKRMTNGRGVDILINTLAGAALEAGWSCMAPFGKFIELGLKDIQARSSLPMHGFSNNVSFTAVDNAHICSDAPQLMQELLAGVMKLVAEKRLGYARPLHKFKISEVEQAMRFLQGGQSTGKVVVEWDPNSQVKVIEDRNKKIFEDDATYVIAGGLGGLGQSMTQWMVDRGAKNLILLSRSGTLKPDAKEFVDRLRTQGIRVEAPPCDITKRDVLSECLTDAGSRLPPVKGAIQASMVLQDGILENMSCKEFRSSTDPKVRGSWNMHECLPTGMDFFILLSSIAGIIGSGSQSNYAAGNTYKDALARYRVSQGECATSLCLGMMQGAGVLARAENETMARMMRSTGYYREMTQEELYGLLDFHCRPRHDVETGAPIPLSGAMSQVVTGIETPATMRGRGVPEPMWMTRPLWRYLFQLPSRDGETATGGPAVVDYAALLKDAPSSEDAAALVTENLVKKLARALMMEDADLDPTRPMLAYGVDSLVAVEVRNWFLKEIRADIAIFDILGSNSLGAVCELAAAKSEYRRYQK